MNVVSAVSNMQQELNYYKETAKEQTAIIKQLTEGPGEFEYIHPFDFGHLLNNNVVFEVAVPNGLLGIIEYNGKKYKQSVHIPAKHTPSFIK